MGKLGDETFSYWGSGDVERSHMTEQIDGETLQQDVNNCSSHEGCQLKPLGVYGAIVGDARFQSQESSGSAPSSCSTGESDENARDPRKNAWKTIFLFGQAIALASASTNAASFTMFYNVGISIPLFQTCIMYSFLSLHILYQFHDKSLNNDECDCQEQLPMFGPIDENCQKRQPTFKLPFTSLRLRVPWWNYFIVAFLDVESNYIVLLSFRYTTLTSTTLLLSLTAPATMLISRCILRRSYTARHALGVLLCLLGGTMTVWSDMMVGSRVVSNVSTPSTLESENDLEVQSRSLLGDFLAIVGALLYGLTDTVAEYAITHIDRVEYLGMLGLFGTIISFVQFPFTEWDNVVVLVTDTLPELQLDACMVMVWYIMSLVAYYILASLFLARADATLLNLSLQTSQLWAILFSVVADGLVPPPLFFVAVILVVSGVFIYEIREPLSASDERTKLITEVP